MNNQYDYESRLDELTRGIDVTFKNVLEPFIYGNILEYIKKVERILTFWMLAVVVVI